jgi:dUTP pyrophosphatase
MIIPGRAAVLQKIIGNLRSADIQVQPCGVDLTLKRMLVWKSSGVVDFDNTCRKIAETDALPFQPDTTVEKPSGLSFVDLPLCSYLVEFNETVDMPLDVMGQIFVRSSLFRSGALLNAGVIDSGYKGTVGALLQVVNPQGLRLWKDARLAQMVFHRMSEPTKGYNGIYQGREAM